MRRIAAPAGVRLLTCSAFLLLTAAACGSDDPGLASTNAEDSSTADTTVTDSGQVADTGAATDTAGTVDVGAQPEDTGPVDTGVDPVDSGPADTGADDTGAPDAGQPECTKDTDCPDASEVCKVNTCAKDQTCQLANAPDGDPCTDGDACTVGDACGNGACLPGAAAKCDDNNPCTDDSCDKGVGCSTKVNAAGCDDGNPCTTSDACSGGTCQGGGTKDCDDGNLCTTDACDPGDGCGSKINNNPCDDGDACTQLDTCSFGKCKGGKTTICNDGNPCTDDACDKTKGCTTKSNSKPCDDGDLCTTGDACKAGTCGAGKPIACNDGNPCTADSCAKASGCKHAPSTNACDDGNACTKGDACTGGKCASGKLIGCDDGKACTTDFCDPAKGCVNAFNKLPCDDGNVCTVADTCAAGACKSGKKRACGDNNPCTNDSCNAKTGCVFLPNKASCDDNNKCTTGDHCSKGSCVPGKAPKCDDSNPCTTPTCDPGKGCTNVPNTHPCSDGNACSVGDRCGGGACKPGKALSCDDGNPCSDDSCNKATGCVFKSHNKPCDDGNACTEGDVCGTKGCVGTKAKNCNDGNACTSDSCDPQSTGGKGGCKNTNTTAACDDGSVCTTADKCSGGACKAGPTLPCKDGNPCTNDGCDAKKGCVFAANSAPCSDGNVCTVGDVCSSGSCKVGKAKDCDDKSPCTLDVCDPAKGCVGIPVNSTCTDSDVCTINERCSGGKCVTDPLGCDDGNPCTTDVCDKAKGCSHSATKDGTACGNGGACKSGKCEIGTKANPASSCNDIQAANPGGKSGIYTIDPDGKGAIKPYDVWCELARDGGGWTLVMTSSDDGKATWTWNNRTLMTTKTTLVGSVTAANRDFKSAAMHNLTFDDLMFVHRPSGRWAVYGGVGNNKKSLAQHMAGIKELTCYKHGEGHAMTAGNVGLSSNGKFCETRLYFHPADRDGNPNKCGDNDGAFGPAWSVANNNPCPFDDPGLVSSLGPKQAGGNNEYNGRGFGWVLGLNKGKGGAAQNYIQVFVRRKIPVACGNGKLEAGEQCDDGNKLGGDGCSGGCKVESIQSCVALGKANPNAKSGIYSVDPDGPGGTAAFSTHCDMSHDGGGWMLAYNSSDDGSHTWSWNNRKLWSDTTPVGSAASWQRDFKSPAAYAVGFKDVLVVHQPSGTWASYHGVGNGKGSIAAHIAGVGGPQCYQAGKGGHKMTKGTLKVGGKLCETSLYFNADDHDGHKTKCGDDEKAWGPVWNARSNQPCPWDDPGLSGTSGPNLSSPTSERPTRGFGAVLGLNKGAAGTATNQLRFYVR